jgi:hypothetical protein
MTDIYFFFKAVINVFWFGSALILLSELYISVMDHPRPEWLVAIEAFYSGLWSGFRWLTDKAFA